METTDKLLEQATQGTTLKLRREAVVELLSTDDWADALQPEVMASQGYYHEDVFVPDLVTIREMAGLLAQGEERLQLLLEKLGEPCTLDLLQALAVDRGDDLVDLALSHLRTAAGGDRSLLLMQVLSWADPAWVKSRAAKRVVHRHLASQGDARQLLLETLAEAGAVEDFLDSLIQYPPQNLDEWSALGESGIEDEGLVDLALASFRYAPDALTYLLRLDPLPRAVAPRVMAAARPLWLIDAMELAAVEKLEHPILLPLAELGIRLGGRPMAMAGAWLSATRLTIPLMECLAGQIQQDDDGDQLSNLIWVRRNAPSADRALEMGRRGEDPDPMDAAALVRQLRGEEVIRLVREILNTPYPTMMDPILRPLCGVYLNAALEVATLAEGEDLDVASRAREAMAWPDVEWE